MSVEEAKKVTVKMGSESFSPPPRRIDDILMLLSEPGQFDPKITLRNRAIADKYPPENANDLILSDFYLSRGKAAIRLNRFQQALEDLRTAYQYAENTGRDDAPFLRPLATAELWAGNSKRAIKLFKRSLKIEKRCSKYVPLVTAYSRMGDLDSAERYKKRGISICGKSNTVWNRIFKESMKADVLEMRGKFEAAELHRRRIMRLAPSIKKDGPSYYIALRARFAFNLVKQEKLIEAELEFRRALKEIIGLAGLESEFTGLYIVSLGEILNKQGRLIEAEKLINAGIRIMNQSGLSSDSLLMGRARNSHGDILVDQGKFSEAMKSFDLAKAELSHNKNVYEKIISRNPSLILSMLKTDRAQEALGLISSAHDTYLKNFGERHYFTQEMRALRGIAYAKMNKEEEAIQDFSEAVPILLNKNLNGKTDYSSKQRFRIIVETYIDLLGRIYGSQIEKKLGIDAVAEAFALADAIRGHAVRRALGASVVRAAVVQPELSDLVRKEQDALNQISAMEFIFTETLAAAEDQRDSKIIEKLRSQIDMLSEARIALQNEIKRRFPKYSELANPEPPEPSSVQSYLRRGEALISIYSTADHTYIWAVPHKGKTQLKRINLSKRELSKIVSNLRIALDPKPEMLGDIPEFDVAAAYKLYSILLKPVESVWGSATDLLIVADGVLGQLPFSVLPTTYVDFNEEENLLFSHYRKIPWLIRKTSLTRMPSAASVISLRSLPQGDPNRKAFIGFGDPIFNQNQLIQAEKEKTDPRVASTSQGKNLHVRGIRVTDSGSLDSSTITTSQLDLLNRLPDTAQEINEMAQTMEADLDRDVILGRQASEQRVKTMNLSDRRVIAFATHALLPGDLDGLDQPALALSSPSVTGEDGDGLLTAGEILKLNLNADWVVLSACNTGAAGGAGAEAVSGLGRAFFYAGTRAILVSMWPVETTSARELTTGLFRYQKKDQRLSRARAFRKSMIDLIEGPGLKDDATDKIIASYAHPLFWAPFIIVGDSNLRF
jgi:CHAT domain-containing protein